MMFVFPFGCIYSIIDRIMVVIKHNSGRMHPNGSKSTTSTMFGVVFRSREGV